MSCLWYTTSRHREKRSNTWKNRSKKNKHFLSYVNSLFFQVVVTNPVDLMCSCYGSHVLRSLLCVCKGVKIDSDFHVTKSSTVLAERLNFRASRIDRDYSHLQQGFPDLLKFLVSGMIKRTRKEIKTLQVDQFGSLVLQACFNYCLYLLFLYAKLTYLLFESNNAWITWYIKICILNLICII